MKSCNPFFVSATSFAFPVISIPPNPKNSPVSTETDFPTGTLFIVLAIVRLIKPSNQPFTEILHSTFFISVIPVLVIRILIPNPPVISIIIGGAGC